MCVYLSLSLSIYIYMYTYTHICKAGGDVQLAVQQAVRQLFTDDVVLRSHRAAAK